MNYDKTFIPSHLPEYVDYYNTKYNSRPEIHHVKFSTVPINDLAIKLKQLSELYEGQPIKVLITHQHDQDEPFVRKGHASDGTSIDKSYKKGTFIHSEPSILEEGKLVILRNSWLDPQSRHQEWQDVMHEVERESFKIALPKRVPNPNPNTVKKSPHVSYQGGADEGCHILGLSILKDIDYEDLKKYSELEDGFITPAKLLKYSPTATYINGQDPNVFNDPIKPDGTTLKRYFDQHTYKELDGSLHTVIQDRKNRLAQLTEFERQIITSDSSIYHVPQKDETILSSQAKTVYENGVTQYEPHYNPLEMFLSEKINEEDALPYMPSLREYDGYKLFKDDFKSLQKKYLKAIKQDPSKTIEMTDLTELTKEGQVYANVISVLNLLIPNTINAQDRKGLIEARNIAQKITNYFLKKHNISIKKLKDENVREFVMQNMADIVEAVGDLDLQIENVMEIPEDVKFLCSFGVPASGKSSYLEQRNQKGITLSKDMLRQYEDRKGNTFNKLKKLAENEPDNQMGYEYHNLTTHFLRFLYPIAGKTLEDMFDPNSTLRKKFNECFPEDSNKYPPIILESSFLNTSNVNKNNQIIKKAAECGVKDIEMFVLTREEQSRQNAVTPRALKEGSMDHLRFMNSELTHGGYETRSKNFIRRSGANYTTGRTKVYDLSAQTDFYKEIAKGAKQAGVNINLNFLTNIPRRGIVNTHKLQFTSDGKLVERSDMVKNSTIN